MQYKFSRLVAGPLLRGLGRPVVTGAEHVPASGGAILASNHLSAIDSVYLPLMLDRPVTFAAKQEYFTGTRPMLRLGGLYMKATRQLSVDRAGARAAHQTLEAALALLLRGELFCIYPEGTRSPDGRLYRGRPGVGWLAMKSGLPVIPVAMIGTDRVLPPGRIVPHFGHITVRIGKPLTFGADWTAAAGGAGAAQAGAGSRENGKPAAGRQAPAKVRRAIADEVICAIQELSGQEYVPMFASDRKAEIAAAKAAGGKPPDRPAGALPRA